MTKKQSDVRRVIGWVSSWTRQPDPLSLFVTPSFAPFPFIFLALLAPTLSLPPSFSLHLFFFSLCLCLSRIPLPLSCFVKQALCGRKWEMRVVGGHARVYHPSINVKAMQAKQSNARRRLVRWMRKQPCSHGPGEDREARLHVWTHSKSFSNLRLVPQNITLNEVEHCPLSRSHFTLFFFLLFLLIHFHPKAKNNFFIRTFSSCSSLFLFLFFSFSSFIATSICHRSIIHHHRFLLTCEFCHSPSPTPHSYKHTNTHTLIHTLLTQRAMTSRWGHTFSIYLDTAMGFILLTTVSAIARETKRIMTGAKTNNSATEDEEGRCKIEEGEREREPLVASIAHFFRLVWAMQE